MYNPEVTYDTHEQWLAIEGKVTDIYPYLSVCHQAHFTDGAEPPDGKYSTFIYLYPYVLPAAGAYEERPETETVPFTRDDLQVFYNNGLDSFHGYWSVHWASDARHHSDKVYPDDYRSVMSFRSIEFMVRPIPDYKDRDDQVEEPRRLYIGWGDIRECVRQALGEPGPMRTFTGVGHMEQPIPVRHKRKQEKERTKITFEWRIDRALPERMSFLVDRWKQHTAFHTTGEYRAKVKQFEQQKKTEEYNQQLQARNPAATRPELLFRAYDPQAQPAQEPVPDRRRIKSVPRRKRTSMDMGTSQELDPSSKRRNVDSESSRSSQSGSAPQSLTSSPEVGRQTPVPGAWPQNTLPPLHNPQYASWGAASQSSRSSQSEYASQSPMPSPATGQQTPTGAQPSTTMLPPLLPYVQGSVSSRSSRSSQSGRSSAYSPDMRRQTPVHTGGRTMMPPPASPRYAQPSYPGTGYGSGQPYAPVPTQHVPAPGSGSAHGQPGGATPPYWPQTPSAPGSWSPGTGNYSPSPQLPSPAMAAPGANVFQYQVPPSGSSGGPSYATGSSYQRPVMAAPGGNVVSYQDPPPGSQGPASSSDPQWMQSARSYMRSTDPQDWDQSGNQGQYGGGRGSGRR